MAMIETPLNVLILAAGQGTRMKSALPKALHSIGGVSLLERLVNTVLSLEPQKIIVVCGHEKEALQSALSHLPVEWPVEWVVQEALLGTGHAALQALPYLQKGGKTLVLFADGPLISSDSLGTLIDSTPQNGLSLLVSKPADPSGLGRIMRDDKGAFLGIVEERDAKPEHLRLKEIFTGILCASTEELAFCLQRLSHDNAQAEYYLTEVPLLALAEGATVNTVCLSDPNEAKGINNKKQLAEQERYFQKKTADNLMLQGLILRDPNRFDLRGDISFGVDVLIEPNVILEGKVTLGDRVSIGANTVIRHCEIGNDVIIKENCVLEDSILGDDCTVGPFARLRPGTKLQQQASIGNFVEIKKNDSGSFY